MKELFAKIQEALLSALPITAIVYVLALTPWFDFSAAELITFTVGAVLLIVGLGLFSLGADMAMHLWVLMWAPVFPGRKSLACCWQSAL